jgi:hypothetical protein
MKRAILLLATALLGTSAACTSHRSPGDLTLFWAFQDASGQSSGQPGDNNGCGVAGVDQIDVTIDRSTQTFPCTGPNAAGITLQTFDPGSYDFTVDGFRGNERVFTGSGVAQVVSNANSATDVVLQPVNPQGFEIFYSVANFSGTTQTTCFFNGQQVAGIWYRLEDANGNVVSTTEVALPGGGVGQQPVACDPKSFGILTHPLPLGVYSLRYLQAVNGSNVAIAQVCSFGVAHTGFPPVIALLQPTGTCP